MNFTNVLYQKAMENKNELPLLISDINKAKKLFLDAVVKNIQGKAKEKAPVWKKENYPHYKGNHSGGTLRNSINYKVDYGNLIGYVGSDVKYARRREYENNLQPQTKFYLRNAVRDETPHIKELATKIFSNLRRN